MFGNSYYFKADTLYSILIKYGQGRGDREIYFDISDNSLLDTEPSIIKRKTRQRFPDDFYSNVEIPDTWKASYTTSNASYAGMQNVTYNDTGEYFLFGDTCGIFPYYENKFFRKVRT